MGGETCPHFVQNPTARLLDHNGSNRQAGEGADHPSDCYGLGEEGIERL